MSLSKLQASFRAKLNSSSSDEPARHEKDYVKEIRQLKQNVEELRTPKLYEKIVSQYKQNSKHKNTTEPSEEKTNQSRFRTFGTDETRNFLQESNRLSTGHVDYQEEVLKNRNRDINKENISETMNISGSSKEKNESSTQTTPKNQISLEEYSKLKEEYDNQKKQLKVMEDDLSKIRVENIKLEKALKTAQESLAATGKNQNNTSSSFSLPSEFKTNWEVLTKDQIVSLYSDFIDNPIIITNMIQEILMICYDNVKTLIKETNKSILKLLNLSDKNETLINKHLASFYQDNFNTIFKLDEERTNKIRDHYKKNVKKIFTHTYTSELANCPENLDDGGAPPAEKTEEESCQNDFKVNIAEEYDSYFDQLLENEDFPKFVASMFSLCVFMLLNDPPLSVPIDNFKNRKFVYRRYKKNEYVCIDGFAKDGAACIIILPSVVRNNYPYNGIKPSVIILQDDFITEKMNSMMDKHEEEEKAKLAKKQQQEKEEKEREEREKEEREKEEKEKQEKTLVLESANVTSNISFDEKYYPQSVNITYDPHMNGPDTRSNSILLPSEPTTTVKQTKKTADLSLVLNKNESLPPRNANLRTQGSSEDPDKDEYGVCLTERREKKSPSFLQLTPQHRSGKEKTRNMSLEKLVQNFREYSREKVSPLSSSRNSRSQSGQDSRSSSTLKERIAKDMYKSKNQERSSHKHAESASNTKLSSFLGDQYYPKKPKAGVSFTDSFYKERDSESKERNPTSDERITSSKGLFTKLLQKNQESKKDLSFTSTNYVPPRKDRTETMRPSEIKEKIRNSFMHTRNTILSTQEKSIISDGSSSLMTSSRTANNSIHLPPQHPKKETELNSTISSLKQSIELLKNAKLQNERIRVKMQDSYDRLNNSMAGKIINQSFRIDSQLNSFDIQDMEDDDRRYRSSSIVKLITSEKQRIIEKKLQKDDPNEFTSNLKKTLHTKYKEVENSQYPLTQDYIKQKLQKLNSNLRSISTNRRSHNPRMDDDSSAPITNESFEKERGYERQLNRINSVNKIANKTDRFSSKEVEDNSKILNILKNIYNKN